MASKIRHVSLLATGDSLGDGTATTRTAIRGIIHYIDIVHGASSSANTDVTVATDGNGPAAQTLFSSTDSNTDGTYYVRTTAVDNTGAALPYDGSSHNVVVPYVVIDHITLTIADQTENKTVTAHIIYEEL